MALTDIQFVNGRLNMFLPIGSSPDTNIDGLTLSEVINNLTISLSGVKSITDQFVFSVSGQVDANALSGGVDATGIRSAIGLSIPNLDIQLTGIKGVVDGLPTNSFITGAIASGDDAALAAIAAEAIKTSGIKEKTDQLVFNSGQVSASVNSVTYSGFQDIFETYQYTESYPATGVNPTPAQSAFLSQQAFTNFTIAGTTISVIGLNGVTVVATYAMDDDTSPTQRIRLT